MCYIIRKGRIHIWKYLSQIKIVLEVLVEVDSYNILFMYFIYVSKFIIIYLNIDIKIKS